MSFSAKLKSFIKFFWNFGILEVRASLFAGIILSLIILTQLFWPKEFFINRFDFLFIAAVTTQILLLKFKHESFSEFKVIIIFHIMAMIMEVFKTSPGIGSWSYAPGFKIGIMGVPLFAGFMYSAVGSYLARSWRLFSLKFSNYPKIGLTVVLAAAIYLQFFLHHFLFDMHWYLFAATIIIFFKTKVYFKVANRVYNMPLNLSFGLIAFFIWIAENIGTYFKAWAYPGQELAWYIVRPEKILAWFLLMILSFVLVSLINKKSLYTNK
jgi:uncharacterized membrane protein YoaT (DUF817 family)